MILVYIALFLVTGMAVGFFGAMLIATVLDWRQARRTSKELMWEELKRTDYKQRRPAAK